MINITLEEARHYFGYNPNTGRLFWKEHPKFPCKNGDDVSKKADPRGYHMVSFKGQLVRAHVLVWFLYYGKWPDNVIDHINGAASDNRIINLRDVTPAVNSMNKRVHREGRPLGVKKCGKYDRWEARLPGSFTPDHKQKYLGVYKTMEEAGDVVQIAILRAAKS
jgi:hypothetical protein